MDDISRAARDPQLASTLPFAALIAHRCRPACGGDFSGDWQKPTRGAADRQIRCPRAQLTGRGAGLTLRYREAQPTSRIAVPGEDCLATVLMLPTCKLARLARPRRCSHAAVTSLDTFVRLMRMAALPRA